MSTHRGLVLALTASLVVAGCGGSSGSSGSLKASSTPPSKAAAEAAAAAMNLTVKDVPVGYEGAPHESSPDSKSQTAAFAACAGASNVDSDTIADVYSQDFSKGTRLNSQKVSSEVQVVKSTRLATSDLKAYQGDKTKTCLATFISKLLAKQSGGAGGATFSAPQITQLTPKADGIEGAFGYQVNLTASAAGLTIPFEIAIEGLLVKHSEVSLTVLSIGGPFPTSDRDALFAKLAARSVSSAV